MNQKDKDSLNYRLHMMYGPIDRNLKDIFIPKKMTEKKEKFLTVAVRSVRDFFTLKPL